MQGRRRGVKGFLSGPIGKILLIVIAILVVTGAFLFAGVLFAILAVLVVGLGIPIWVGASQPRYLAVLGVAVLAVSPALITAIEVPLIMTPPGVSSTNDGLMQNATVTPFLGSPGQVFNWTVQIFATYLPTGFNTINLTLYISTCPGAINNNSAFCSAGYPLYWVGASIPNLTRLAPQTVTLHYAVPTSDIWNWQMVICYGKWNQTSGQFGNQTYESLVGDPSYNAIEGPITANWNGVYYLLVGSIYLSTLLYIGLAFFVALLVYMLFRMRRVRRQQDAQRAQAPPPPSSTPPATGAPLSSGKGPAPPAGSPPTTAPHANEVSCPNCGAVVYPNETFCWKCGGPLAAKGASSTGPASPPKG